MNELQRAAAEAWAAMTRRPGILARPGLGDDAGPMPVGLALDYCQNVTGDRDDAVTALIKAAADWLDQQTVPGGDTCIDLGNAADREVIVAHLRGEGCGLASVFLAHVRQRCESATHPRATGAERFAAAKWSAWADKAAIAVAKSREVIEAAYPVES